MPFWPDPIPRNIIGLYLGPILIILGLLIMFLPIISYLARGLKKDDEYQSEQFKFPKGTAEPILKTWIYIAIFTLIPLSCGLPSLLIGNLLNLKLMIPYIVADAFISSYIIQTIFTGAILAVIIWYLSKNNGLELKNIGLDFSKDKIIQAIIVGVGAPLIFFGLWDLFMSCHEIKEGLKKLGFKSPKLQ